MQVDNMYATKKHDAAESFSLAPASGPGKKGL